MSYKLGVAAIVASTVISQMIVVAACLYSNKRIDRKYCR